MVYAGEAKVVSYDSSLGLLENNVSREKTTHSLTYAQPNFTDDVDGQLA
tara:strand:- start:3073 stop:3219 length:147 start_codon:yes stop_codon:yes gene_type:complete